MLIIHQQFNYCEAANTGLLNPLPFISGIEVVRNHFELNKQEESLLQSEEAPIVLLYPKDEAY
jgi:hypothetical protein